MENNNQKICKISMSSSDYSEYLSEDSIDCEHTPENSVIYREEDALELINLVKQTLNQRKISLDPNGSTIERLKQAVSAVCTEFLKATHDSTYNTADKSMYNTGDILSSKELIEKIFEAPDKGIHLSNTECKEFSGVVVGLIREITNTQFAQKLKTLEATVFNCAKTINQLRMENKTKDIQLERLQKKSENLRPSNSKKTINKVNLPESDTTFNESEDT